MVVAIMGVILEVYDNMIGDQFISPLTSAIPVIGNALDFMHLNDLPYMFLLMVGIAMIRKPGCVTAMVMLNYLLMQLLYGGSGDNPLQWPDGLTQGIMVDMYMVWRGGKVFENPKAVFWDALVMGMFRAVPNTPIGGLFLDSTLQGQYHTVLSYINDIWSNAVGNGLEAAFTAPLAIRIAKSVNLMSGTNTQMGDVELQQLQAGAGSQTIERGE